MGEKSLVIFKVFINITFHVHFFTSFFLELSCLVVDDTININLCIWFLLKHWRTNVKSWNLLGLWGIFHIFLAIMFCSSWRLNFWIKKYIFINTSILILFTLIYCIIGHPDLKRMLAGKKFSTNEEVIAKTEAYFEAKEKDLFYYVSLRTFQPNCKDWQIDWLTV
jgi:peptidoglycan biosynthesis protein MviN/MurJ (putative lipid II flippase)